MDVRKLSGTLIGLGALALIAAFVWWLAFYSEVARGLGGRDANVFDAISCLWSNGGLCGFVAGMAQAGGATPYSPAVFWIGGALLIVGIVVKMATKPTAAVAPIIAPAAGAENGADPSTGVRDADERERLGLPSLQS
jgi:hypothetical protein